MFRAISKTEKEKKSMDVLIVEPEKSPRMASITGDLNSLQQVVGGCIEAVFPYDDPVAIVCHEEGKLIGLPLNRKLEDYDIIAGTFIVCGLGEEDFDSLTPELAEKYREKFADPEIFMKMGNRIVAIPIKPKDDLHVAKPKQKSTEPEL
jgi:hypothetical protein